MSVSNTAETPRTTAMTRRARSASSTSYYDRPPPSRRSDYYYYSDDEDNRATNSYDRRRPRDDSLPPYEETAPGDTETGRRNAMLKKGLLAGALVVAVGAFTVWQRKKERERKERKRRDFERAKRRRRREEEKREREMELESEDEGEDQGRIGEARRIEYRPSRRETNKSRGRREIVEGGDGGGGGDERGIEGDASNEGRDYERARSRA